MSAGSGGMTAMHVLLVEDDPVTSAMIKRVLKREEFSCDCVDLGEDAIERCKSYNYDIIILDLIMPDIDGFEVLRRLRGAQV